MSSYYSWHEAECMATINRDEIIISFTISSIIFLLVVVLSTVATVVAIYKNLLERLGKFEKAEATSRQDADAERQTRIRLEAELEERSREMEELRADLGASERELVSARRLAHEQDAQKEALLLRFGELEEAEATSRQDADAERQARIRLEAELEEIRAGTPPDAAPSQRHSVESIKNFVVHEELGSGAFGRVALATWTTKGRVVALKKVEQAHLLQEGEIQMSLRHPNVLEMYATLDFEGSKIFVLEFAAGGTLHNEVLKGPFTEVMASRVMLEIASALSYCHGRGVIHRDVKLENILIADDYKLKLSDFGLSVKANGNRRMTLCGTLNYMAPEIVQNHEAPVVPYDHSVDIWALGVIVFECLVGGPAFEGRDQEETRRNIIRAELMWPDYITVSSEAKDLITQLVQAEPSRRLPLEQVLMHPWVRRAS